MKRWIVIAGLLGLVGCGLQPRVAMGPEPRSIGVEIFANDSRQTFLQLSMFFSRFEDLNVDTLTLEPLEQLSDCRQVPCKEAQAQERTTLFLPAGPVANHPNHFQLAALDNEVSPLDVADPTRQDVLERVGNHPQQSVDLLH